MWYSKHSLKSVCIFVGHVLVHAYRHCTENGNFKMWALGLSNMSAKDWLRGTALFICMTVNIYHTEKIAHKYRFFLGEDMRIYVI